jgi:hypothetical protein
MPRKHNCFFRIFPHGYDYVMLRLPNEQIMLTIIITKRGRRRDWRISGQNQVLKQQIKFSDHSYESIGLSYYNDNQINNAMKYRRLEKSIFLHQRTNKKIACYLNSYHISTILLIFILLSASSAVATSLTYNIANAQQQTTTMSSPSSSNPNNISSAQSIYMSQSLTLPISVSYFVWYIVDEAHEDTVHESQKIISNHNPNFLPTNLVIPQNVTISFLDADAPWDTPHPHTINVIDKSSDKIVYTTGKLEYTKSSKPVILPAGKYSVVDTKYKWMKGSISVLSNEKSNGSLGVGGFYAPTKQVANKKDNDGGVHPGWLGYYKTEFPKEGFSILSEYNFHYTECKYCPGGYWPDQKTGDHTLIVYSTKQSLSDVLGKLEKLVWNNVYI